MDDPQGDWSVVGKKDKKVMSPHPQKKKNLKRTDLQRSSSSNQMGTRRKLEMNKSMRLEKEEITRSEEAVKDVRRSSRIAAVHANGSDEVTESTLVAQDTLANIIDDVSTGIKRLSIDPRQQISDIVKYSDSVGVEPASSIKIMSSVKFCEMCRNFNPSRSVVGRFQARYPQGSFNDAVYQI